MSGIPELLYHTTLTVVDYHVDKSGSTRTVYVLGTHTTIEAAKAFSAKALQILGYEPDDFAAYAVRQGSTTDDWQHGDGVIVYAKAPAGQVFLVGIETTTNDQEFAAGPDGTILLSAFGDAPSASSDNPAEHLHYVLQTNIDYEKDRSGAAQTTLLEGCYLHRSEAVTAAKACLKGTGYDFEKYEEFDESVKDEWPYGEDVVVHAVSKTGENYLVAIRTIPGAHKKHAKKNQKKQA